MTIISVIVSVVFSCSCQREPCSCNQELGLEFSETDVIIDRPREIVFAFDEHPFNETKSLSGESVDGTGKGKLSICVQSEALPLPEQIDKPEITKADVTSMSSFYVTCVTGSAGSESSVWENIATSGSSPYSTGKYWPANNPGYKFYASNASMSFAASGTTITASNNSTDIVVAYNTDATYNAASIPLTFNHIFGKLGDVTVSPDEGFSNSDITDVSISITPKTGGVYNMRTGTWSSVTNGSNTAIANSTPGTKTNDIYMVPGTYTISANWTCKGTAFSGNAEITISASEKKNLNVSLGGQQDIIVDVQMGYQLLNEAYFDTNTRVPVSSIPFDDYNKARITIPAVEVTVGNTTTYCTSTGQLKDLMVSLGATSVSITVTWYLYGFRLYESNTKVRVNFGDEKEQVTEASYWRGSYWSKSEIYGSGVFASHTFTVDTYSDKYLYLTYDFNLSCPGLILHKHTTTGGVAEPSASYPESVLYTGGHPNSMSFTPSDCTQYVWQHTE